MAKFLAEGGIEYDGDELLTVFFTNGVDQTMLAGQGGYLALGGDFQFQKIKSLMLRATIGYKYNTTAASNANIRLTRLPINIIPYWKINEDLRIGIGITTHQIVNLNGYDFIADVVFTSPLGLRFELGYKWVALTYTAIKYKADTNESFSASSLGVSLSLTFPAKFDLR